MHCGNLRVWLLTSSIDLAQVGETPDVTQTHGKADTGQQVLDLVVPLGPVVHVRFAHLQLKVKIGLCLDLAGSVKSSSLGWRRKNLLPSGEPRLSQSPWLSDV